MGPNRVLGMQRVAWGRAAVGAQGWDTGMGRCPRAPVPLFYFIFYPRYTQISKPRGCWPESSKTPSYRGSSQPKWFPVTAAGAWAMSKQFVAALPAKPCSGHCEHQLPSAHSHSQPFPSPPALLLQ